MRTPGLLAVVLLVLTCGGCTPPVVSPRREVPLEAPEPPDCEPVLPDEEP